MANFHDMQGFRLEHMLKTCSSKKGVIPFRCIGIAESLLELTYALITARPFPTLFKNNLILHQTEFHGFWTLVASISAVNRDLSQSLSDPQIFNVS